MPRPNRLALEPSPYLRQHALQAVDWYPWGPEVLERARREERMIFLSIGYSTCHWCHVMAHESFDDPEVARALNEQFLCVKVDREERPDIDHVFMSVCQLLTGGGGWPLTVLLLPDGRPFFAGTYFPRQSRFGRLGLLELIARVSELWATQRERLLGSAEQILAQLQGLSEPPPSSDVPMGTLIERAFSQLSRLHDPVSGGFGGAPKFPTPHHLLFLALLGARGEPRALDMARTTLEAIARGGIWDHVGHGLHRYSVDANWRVPHFEKMLYDQALLTLAALELGRQTRAPGLLKLASETLGYLRRDLASPEGAFYAAEDADSEGEEGVFYVWTLAELEECVGIEDLRFMRERFLLDQEGNFAEAGQETRGRNVLARSREMDDEREAPAQEERWERIRGKLLERRGQRARPHRDEKILTDWNGLAIAAFARASWVLKDPSLLEIARRNADHLLGTARDAEGGLLHRQAGGEAGIAGFLDDHAFLAWGLLELYEASFEERYLREALTLVDQALLRFWDDQGGTCFSSATDEALPLRPRSLHDGALPSGNAVLAQVLLRLHLLSGDTRFAERAEKLLEAARGEVERGPAAHTALLDAAERALHPPLLVVICGEEEDPRVKEMIELVRRDSKPKHLMLKRAVSGLGELAPFTRTMGPVDGGPVAHVCSGAACGLPVTGIGELSAALEGV